MNKRITSFPNNKILEEVSSMIIMKAEQIQTEDDDEGENQCRIMDEWEKILKKPMNHQDLIMVDHDMAYNILYQLTIITVGVEARYRKLMEYRIKQKIIHFNVYEEAMEYVQDLEDEHQIVVFTNPQNLNKVSAFLGELRSVTQIFCFVDNPKIMKISTTNRKIKKISGQEDLSGEIIKRKKKTDSFLPLSFHDKASAVRSYINLTWINKSESNEDALRDFLQFVYISSDLEDYGKDKNDCYSLRNIKSILKCSSSVGRDLTTLYTGQSYFYKIINKAMRSLFNPSHISFLRIVYSHIYSYIQDEFLRKTGKLGKVEGFQCYRGTFLSSEEINYLKSNQGGFIIFQGFCSTSRVRKQALEHFGDHLFQITVPTVEAKYISFNHGFISLEQISKRKNQQQILFNPHNIFRVERIEEKNKTIQNVIYSYYQVSLTLVLDKNNFNSGKDATQKKNNEEIQSYLKVVEAIKSSISSQKSALILGGYASSSIKCLESEFSDMERIFYRFKKYQIFFSNTLSEIMQKIRFYSLSEKNEKNSKYLSEKILQIDRNRIQIKKIFRKYTKETFFDLLISLFVLLRNTSQILKQIQSSNESNSSIIKYVEDSENLLSQMGQNLYNFIENFATLFHTIKNQEKQILKFRKSQNQKQVLLNQYCHYFSHLRRRERSELSEKLKMKKFSLLSKENVKDAQIERSLSLGTFNTASFILLWSSLVHCFKDMSKDETISEMSNLLSIIFRNKLFLETELCMEWLTTQYYLFSASVSQEKQQELWDKWREKFLRLIIEKEEDFIIQGILLFEIFFIHSKIDKMKDLALVLEMKINKIRSTKFDFQLLKYLVRILQFSKSLNSLQYHIFSNLRNLIQKINHIHFNQEKLLKFMQLLSKVLILLRQYERRNLVQSRQSSLICGIQAITIEKILAIEKNLPQKMALIQVTLMKDKIKFLQKQRKDRPNRKIEGQQIEQKIEQLILHDKKGISQVSFLQQLLLLIRQRSVKSFEVLPEIFRRMSNEDEEVKEKVYDLVLEELLPFILEVKNKNMILKTTNRLLFERKKLKQPRGSFYLIILFIREVLKENLKGTITLYNKFMMKKKIKKDKRVQLFLNRYLTQHKELIFSYLNWAFRKARKFLGKSDQHWEVIKNFTKFIIILFRDQKIGQISKKLILQIQSKQKILESFHQVVEKSTKSVNFVDSFELNSVRGLKKMIEHQISQRFGDQEKIDLIKFIKSCLKKKEVHFNIENYILLVIGMHEIELKRKSQSKNRKEYQFLIFQQHRIWMMFSCFLMDEQLEMKLEETILYQILCGIQPIELYSEEPQKIKNGNFADMTMIQDFNHSFEKQKADDKRSKSWKSVWLIPYFHSYLILLNAGESKKIVETSKKILSNLIANLQNGNQKQFLKLFLNVNMMAHSMDEKSRKKKYMKKMMGMIRELKALSSEIDQSVLLQLLEKIMIGLTNINKILFSCDKKSIIRANTFSKTSIKSKNPNQDIKQKISLFYEKFSSLSKKNKYKGLSPLKAKESLTTVDESSENSAWH